jgi:hypothetical protein
MATASLWVLYITGGEVAQERPHHFYVAKWHYKKYQQKNNRLNIKSVLKR